MTEEVQLLIRKRKWAWTMAPESCYTPRERDRDRREKRDNG